MQTLSFLAVSGFKGLPNLPPPPVSAYRAF